MRIGGINRKGSSHNWVSFIVDRFKLKIEIGACTISNPWTVIIIIFYNMAIHCQELFFSYRVHATKP